MKQRTLLYHFMLLVCLLVWGAGSAWGQMDYSAVYSSGCTVSGATSSTIVINSTNYSGQKAGTGKAGGSINVTVPAATKYLHLHISGWKGENPSVAISSSPSVAELVSSISVTANDGFNNNSPFTFSGDASSSTYYKVITFTNPLEAQTTLTFSTSSGNNRFIIWGVNAEALPSSVTIKNGDNPVSTLNMTQGDEDVTLSATVAPANANPSVSWTSSNTSVATVTNGVVHAAGVGSATITATSTLNTVYASCTVNVAAASADLGEVVFTPGEGEYYYGQSITISAANAEHIYYTLDESTPTTSSSEYTAPLTITDDVTIKVLATKSAEEKTGEADFLLKAPEAPSVSLASGGVTEGTTFTLAMGEGGSKVVYTTDGTDPTASSTTYTSAIEINSPITLKAATVDGGNNLSTIVTRTYTIVIEKNETLWNEDFSSYSADDTPSGGTYSYSCTHGGSNTKIWAETNAGGKSPELLVGKSTGVFQATVPLSNVSGTLTLTFKTNNTNLGVSSTTAGVTLTGNTRAKGGTSTVTISGVTSGMTALVIKFSNTYSSNCRLDDILLKYNAVIATQPVTIGASGYATYCSTSALDFSEADVNAYKAKVNGSSVVLTKLEQVPANVGVILYSDNSGNYNIPVAESASAVTENEMVGVTERTQVNWNVETKYNYILQSGQFNKANGGYLKANRAYLSTAYDVEAAAKPLTIVFDEEDETDGIASIENGKSNIETSAYNLAGQRVDKDYKGIVIVNGKKMLNK